MTESCHVFRALKIILKSLERSDSIIEREKCQYHSKAAVKESRDLLHKAVCEVRLAIRRAAQPPRLKDMKKRYNLLHAVIGWLAIRAQQILVDGNPQVEGRKYFQDIHALCLHTELHYRDIPSSLNCRYHEKSPRKMEFTGRKRKYDEIQTPKTETGDSSTPEEAIIDHTDPRLVDEAVCYGAVRLRNSEVFISSLLIKLFQLHDVAAKPINKAKIRKELSSKATESSFSIFSIRSDKGCYLVSFKDGKDAAILDVETTSKLRALKSHPVRFDAVLQSNIFSKSHSDSGGSAKIIPLSINIFGPKRCAEDIASQLAKVSGFLQHPKMLNPGIEYYNPQYLAFPDETIDMNEFVDTGKDTARAQKVKISEEVEDILDSLAEFTYDTNFQRPAGLVTTLRRLAIIHTGSKIFALIPLIQAPRAWD